MGRQTKATVMDGCWLIHQAMLQYQSFRILNDNRHVIGDWNSAAIWVGTIWFPRMEKDGLQRFGWVQNVVDQPKASTQMTLSTGQLNGDIVKLFKDFDKAYNWLVETRN